MKFKEFLLNEDRAYLGLNIGDILTALQDLADNGKSMGTRQLQRYAEEIVSAIRKIIHGSWPKEEYGSLEILQDISVAMMKSIKEKEGDINELIPDAIAALQKLMQKLEVPFNNLETVPKGKQPDESGVGEPPQPTQDQPAPAPEEGIPQA